MYVFGNNRVSFHPGIAAAGLSHAPSFTRLHRHFTWKNHQDEKKAMPFSGKVHFRRCGHYKLCICVRHFILLLFFGLASVASSHSLYFVVTFGFGIVSSMNGIENRLSLSLSSTSARVTHDNEIKIELSETEKNVTDTLPLYCSASDKMPQFIEEMAQFKRLHSSNDINAQPLYGYSEIDGFLSSTLAVTRSTN